MSEVAAIYDETCHSPDHPLYVRDQETGASCTSNRSNLRIRGRNLMRDEPSRQTTMSAIPVGSSDLSSEPRYTAPIASFSESRIFAGDSGENERGRFADRTDLSTHFAESPSHSSQTHSGLKPLSFGWVDPMETNAETDAIGTV